MALTLGVSVALGVWRGEEGFVSVKNTWKNLLYFLK